MTHQYREQETTGFEIAVIGMACRFPGAADIESFWRNLVNGVETIAFFSEEELIANGVDETLLRDPGYVPARGVVADRDKFDCEFFDITPLEAEVMDPQVRLFLQCCVHALDDAGIVPAQSQGPIGLYAGAGGALLWEAYQLLSPKTGTIGSFASSLLRKDYLCSKTSYKLGLNGPAVSVQTACSTSLVAIHLACQGLIGGECDFALAGGVTLSHEGTVGYLYREGMIGSADGHCRAFDIEAAGTVPGEGVGVVALQRLTDAISQGRHIYALVKGSAINNDGDRKVGFTAPSVAGQAEAIRNALAMAGVCEDTIGYIETHGTGTSLGDPVELAALKKVFPQKNGVACPIGSVKTNLGHLDAAAGVAGFIKTALCLYHRLLPPSLHFCTPNPALGIDESRFFVNASLRSWQESPLPRRAGVSAFGIGGTNAHAILEEYIAPPATHKAGSGDRHHLLLLSAKTPQALAAMSHRLAQFFIRHPQTNLEAAAHTLRRGRATYFYRKTIAAASIGEVADLLAGASGSAASGISPSSSSSPAIIFMFPGQGTQHAAMGRDLYIAEPVFRNTLERCFDIVEKEAGLHLRDYLRFDGNGGDGSDRDGGQAIPDTHIAQPLLVSFQYAMASLLRHWGVVPAAMTGHSVGQYTAACLAGVMSLEDCLRLTAHRGRLMQALPAGAMLAVPLPEEELLPLLNQSLSLAAVNAPNRCVVSGLEEAIDELSLQLKNRGIDSTRLHTSHAFHSQMMDPILEEFADLAASVAFTKPEIPFISNLTGDWISDAEVLDPRYWVAHLRRAVRFADGISTISRLNRQLFIDIGPGKTMATFVRQHPGIGPEPAVVQLSPHPGDRISDRRFMLEGIGSIWRQGAAIDWEAFDRDCPRKFISLPGYPFAETVFTARVDFSTLQIPGAGTPCAGMQPSLSSQSPTFAEETVVAPPRSEIQNIVVSAFESFFGKAPLGPDHDFYDLGGDSLSAIQLADLIQKRGIYANFRQLLIHPIIGDFCRSIHSSASSTPERPISGSAVPNDQPDPELSNLTEQLTQLLKQNLPALRYRCSPVQRFALEGSDPELPIDFILFRQEFPLDRDFSLMRRDLSSALAQNPLMRSLVVRDDDEYKIEEYEGFSNIEIPFIDLSCLSPAEKDRREHELILLLRQPIDVIGNILFRPLLVKWQADSLCLIIAFHHLIFDGTSVALLKERLLLRPDAPDASYRTYVEFLEARDYSRLELEPYIDLFRYSSAIKTAQERFEIGQPTIDELEFDIALIPETMRHAYEDFLILAFGELVRRVCDCAEAPIAQVSSGRVYADARFTGIAGDFHDVIPILLPKTEGPFAGSITRLGAYRRFIKDNNLNFLNYLLKNRSHLPEPQLLLSPFGFNAVPAGIDSFRRARALDPDFLSRQPPSARPSLSLQLYEDLDHRRLFIVFIHKSRWPVREEFLDIVQSYSN